MLLDALTELLTAPRGPLAKLHLYTLPADQVDAVDVGVTPLAGIGADQYVFGERRVHDGGTGVTTDAGVDRWHSGVLFEIRSAVMDRPDAIRKVIATGDAIRNVLAQIRWKETALAGEVLINLEPDANVALLERSGGREMEGRRKVSNFTGRDRLGRVTGTMTCECWHRPDWAYTRAELLLTPGGLALATPDGTLLTGERAA